jgi:hypothetical protein
MDLDYPPVLLEAEKCADVCLEANSALLYRGLRVKIGMAHCDNPVVGKHLDENTRSLAEILLLSTICIRLLLVYYEISMSALRALFILGSSFGPSVCTPTAYRT